MRALFTTEACIVRYARLTTRKLIRGYRIQMNIIVVEHNNFSGECEFTPLAAVKCGWSQYGDVPIDEMADQCWRADIVVSLKKPIDEELLKKTYKT